MAERLLAEGRMHPAGVAELERARADGRSKAAYAGSATIEVPPDLADALAGEPKAQEMFVTLSRQNRYAILYGILRQVFDLLCSEPRGIGTGCDVLYYNRAVVGTRIA